MAVTRASSRRSTKASKSLLHKVATTTIAKPARRAPVHAETNPVATCPREVEELNAEPAQAPAPPPAPPPAPRPAARPGWTTPRTNKPLSAVLEGWIDSEPKHGYSFREDVLLGDEPDEDYGTRFPCDWEQVAKCLRSEISGERILFQNTSARLRKFFNPIYYRDCKKALEEVLEFYL